MITTRTVQVSVNSYPASVKEKLQKLEPGQIRRVRLSPAEFHTVDKKIYPDADATKATWSGKETRCAEHSIPANGWTINAEVDGITQPFLVGFVDRYDTDGSPVFREVSFGNEGVVVFDGNKPRDVQDFEVIQLYLEMKVDPLAPEVAGAPYVRRNWRFYVEDVAQEAKGYTDNFKLENEIRNKLASLVQEDINILMGPPVWGRGFCLQPHLVGKGTIDAGIRHLMTIFQGKDGATRITKLLKSLMEVKELEVLVSGLKGKHIIALDDQIQRADGVTLAKLKEPLKGTDSQIAEQILGMYPTNKDWNEKLSKWLRAELKK